MSGLHKNWEQLDPLLEQALDLPLAQRQGFIQDLQNTHPELAKGLVRLLANAEAQAHWLTQGAAISAAISTDMLNTLAATGSHQPGLMGQQVGPYEIVQELGHGGMAQVFLGRRNDGLFEQQVALKMMWQGMLRDDLLSRFERERQILADLNDPHIASLLDGGVTPEGRPWLAMEYVPGQPVDEYCKTHSLDLNQRLALLADVAAAVAAAHRLGIIHRDIKPSNVMVDENGQVKLVDFGIAKLLGQGQEAATVTEARLLTPEYASPEQLDGHNLGLESDIYQLGLLLFELITGQRPFTRGNDSPLTFQRKIVEQPAPRASDVARRQGITGLKVDRDLDAIILKCLEKQAPDRYASVSDLTQDLSNYQRGLPLLANTGQRWHRMAKFVSRHRLGVAVAGLFTLTLVAYAGTVTWQSGRITTERDAARLEAAKAREIAGFLQDLFANASPEVSLGQDLSIKEMVNQGSEQLANKLADQPALKAAMLENLGGIYFSLGEYPTAVDHFQRSLEIRQLDSDGDPELAQTLLQLARAQRGAGQFDQALVNLHQALDQMQGAAEPEPLAIAEVYNALGITLSELGDYKPAGEYHRKALDIRAQRLTEDDLTLAAARADYGVVLHRQARRQEAAELYRQAVEVQEAKLGPTHPRTLITLRNLAALEIGLNNLPEAERLFHQVLERERSIYQGDHPKQAWTLGYLGKVAADQQQLGKAEMHWRETVRLLTATLPENHLHIAGANQQLAEVLLKAGKVDEACERLESTLKIRLRQRGDQAVRTNQSRFHLGRCRASQGDAAEAVSLLQQARPYLLETDDAPALDQALATLRSVGVAKPKTDPASADLGG